MATERMVNGTVPPLATSLHLLVFGSTLVIYNLPVIINSRAVSRFYSRRGLFFFLGAALSLYSLTALPRAVMEGALVLGIFSVGYSTPILPFLKKKPLRQLGWIKTLDLSVVWTVTTHVLPLLYWGKNVFAFPIEFLLRFVLIFSLCVLFDLRDLGLDHANNLRTLPLKLGVRNSYRLLYASVVLFALFSVVQYFRFQMPWKLAVGLLTTLLLSIVIGYVRKNPTHRVYLSLVDGVMLFYGVMVLLVP